MILINQNQKIKFLVLLIQFKKTNYNTKISEIEAKIPSITGLAKYYRPSVTNLVKKTDYDKKVSDINKKITDHTT